MTHYAKVNAAFKIGAILDLYCHGRIFYVYHHVNAVARQEFHLRLRPGTVKPLLRLCRIVLHPQFLLFNDSRLRPCGPRCKPSISVPPVSGELGASSPSAIPSGLDFWNSIFKYGNLALIVSAARSASLTSGFLYFLPLGTQNVYFVAVGNHVGFFDKKSGQGSRDPSLSVSFEFLRYRACRLRLETILSSPAFLQLLLAQRLFSMREI